MLSKRFINPHISEWFSLKSRIMVFEDKNIALTIGNADIIKITLSLPHIPRDQVMGSIVKAGSIVQIIERSSDSYYNDLIKIRSMDGQHVGWVHQRFLEYSSTQSQC